MLVLLSTPLVFFYARLRRQVLNRQKPKEPELDKWLEV
jgi:hypothetical protein